MQSGPQPKSYRWDETLITTPTNIWAAILLVVCRLLPPKILTKKPLFFFFSRWDVVCLCIHWVVRETIQHPFLIHNAGDVYTICVLSLLLFCIRVNVDSPCIWWLYLSVTAMYFFLLQHWRIIQWFFTLNGMSIWVWGKKRCYGVLPSSFSPLNF